LSSDQSVLQKVRLTKWELYFSHCK